MRHFTTSLLAIILFAACTSPSQHRRMEAMLADYEQRNSQYDTLSIDSTRRLADFFSRHGDAHQRMRAYYLLGCAHETAGESPQALDLFYKSLEQADTTASDCDYKRLSRIHWQMAQLLIKQHVLAQALNEIEKIDRYAFLAKDTLMRLINLEQKGHVLRMQGKKDSAFLVSERTVKLFNDCGMKLQAVRASGPIIGYLLEHGKLSEAKRLMDVYEKESGFFNDTHMTLLKNKTYYYYRGNYYLQTEQLDSAAYFFRKEIREAGITNNLETGYLGLCRYFQKKHMPDSAVKYALLSREMNDSCYNELSTDYYQRMQASFNYSRAERKAMEKEREAWAYKNAIVLIAILVLLLSFAVARFIRHQKQASQNEQMAANAEYSKLLLRFNQAQQDLALFQSDAQQFCLQKEKEMEILREKLSLLRGNYGMAEQWTLEQTMLNSPVITELHEQASKTSKPSRAQWVDLLSLAERELPLLYKKLASSEPPLTDQEMIAALLIRLQFTQGELASLLGVSKQRVNNIKRNINKKIFQQEGAVTLNGNIFSI